MHIFRELKNLALEKINKGELSYTFGDLNFQFYQSSVCQFNISTITADFPVIKFEERSDEIFTVAVAEKNGTEKILYAKSKQFQMDDSITTLLQYFDYGKDINIVVGDLLKL